MNPPLAILGGTFDPVHNAHLAVARHALEALGCERVLWIPTGAPAYRAAPIASAPHRVAMLRLALAGEPRLAIDERELAPGHSGYTVDTLIALRAETDSKAPMVLLMGADQYSRLETWYRWRDLVKLCRIAVFERPGAPAPQGDVIRAAMPALAISASDARARLARGEDVSTMLPSPVLGYIREHALYR